jgi:methylated-DNA-[protein]-cysteine S-methyltransferase
MRTARHSTHAGPARYCLLPSPIGTLLLVGRPDVVEGLYVADHDHAPAPGADWVEDPGALGEATRQLEEYFAGERLEFELELAASGTPWQRAVWDALVTIPFGHTVGYGRLAAQLGRPGAGRAVGAANGTNPISIVVPCHRVIGADGKLTGYGWGPERKAWLIDHERAVLSSRSAGSHPALPYG